MGKFSLRGEETVDLTDSSLHEDSSYFGDNLY